MLRLTAEMSVEDQTKLAVKMTHMVLTDIVFSQRGASVLAYMVANDIHPEDIEDKVSKILGYLIKTEPEEAGG